MVVTTFLGSTTELNGQYGRPPSIVFYVAFCIVNSLFWIMARTNFEVGAVFGDMWRKDFTIK